MPSYPTGVRGIVRERAGKSYVPRKGREGKPPQRPGLRERAVELPHPHTMPMTSPFTLHLFGPLRVEVRGEALPRLPSRSVEWLLALLALRHDRSIDRSWLAGTLWPDSDELRALQNLRNNLVA